VLGDALTTLEIYNIKYTRDSESKMVKFKQCLERFSDIDASNGCFGDPTR